MSAFSGVPDLTTRQLVEVDRAMIEDLSDRADPDDGERGAQGYRAQCNHRTRPHGGVFYECIRMPDSAGFGDYTESGQVIPALLNGEHVNFTAQMYLDDEPPIAGGREIWGFPKKHANPKLSIIHDTFTGVLEYAGVIVAVATMGYKHQNLLYDVKGRKQCSKEAIIEKMSATQVNLKIIPDIDGSQAIAQLVGYNLTDIQVKGGWSGPARLQLHAHVNAPVADLPVRKVHGGVHFIADLTLPYGRVLHDYNSAP